MCCSLVPERVSVFTIDFEHEPLINRIGNRTNQFNGKFSIQNRCNSFLCATLFHAHKNHVTRKDLVKICVSEFDLYHFAFSSASHILATAIALCLYHRACRTNCSNLKTRTKNEATKCHILYEMQLPQHPSNRSRAIFI